MKLGFAAYLWLLFGVLVALSFLYFEGPRRWQMPLFWIIAAGTFVLGLLIVLRPTLPV